MSRIYVANLELVNMGARLGRGVVVLFRAPTDPAAADAAMRAARCLASADRDGYGSVGAVKLSRFLPPRMEASGYLASGSGIPCWEWKSDHDRGLPLLDGKDFALPVGLYEARVTFTQDGQAAPEVFTIRFAADGDFAAVADARRWAEERQRAFPTWFGRVMALEVARLDPGYVEPDGSLRSHLGETFHAEQADTTAPLASPVPAPGDDPAVVPPRG